jgi:transposase
VENGAADPAVVARGARDQADGVGCLLLAGWACGEVEGTPQESYQKNPTQGEEFKQAIVAKLEGLGVPRERAVHVWVGDEHRYGLIGVLRRCWTLKGYRPKAPYQTKYQWGYVHAAADIGRGRAEFLYTPTVSLSWSRLFLEQVVATHPEAVHIMIWDRAGFHPKAVEGSLSASLRLLPLPAYTPELNPIEPLWDQVKRGVANEAWESLPQIERAIEEVLEPFWQETTQVRSLLGDSWLTRGVATFLDRRKSIISN